MQAFALNLAPKPALQPALHFDNVSKRYGPGPLILDRVSFAVEPGAFFGLAGINGAGKTSLIKCLLDLADFSSGNISIFGAPSRDSIFSCASVRLPCATASQAKNAA